MTAVVVPVTLITPELVVPFTVDTAQASISGTVHPASAAESEAYRRSIRDETAAKVSEAEASFICAHVRTWNLADTVGEPLHITPEVVKALPAPVYEVLVPVVIGRVGYKLVGEKKPVGGR